MTREISRSADLELLALLVPFEGLDTWASPFILSDGTLTDLRNLIWRRIAGALALTPGRVALGTALPASLLGLGRFSNATSSGPRSIAVLNEATVSWKVIDDSGAVSAVTLPYAWAAAKTKFATFAQKNLIIGVNGQTAPIKLRKDNLGTATKVGIDKPATAPTVVAGAAGNLNGKYQWRVTFESPTHESSPGPVSLQLTLSNQQANLSGIPTSSDPQVTKRNIYRIGGVVPEWRFVGQINNNTTTTFTDNVADSALGEPLGFDRDPPRATLQGVVEHKQRLFGFDGNELLISNYQEPEGWDAKNVIVVGGSGPIKALASTGSVLLILKDTEALALLGDTTADFILLPIAKKGVLAPDSVVSVEGLVFWLADDGVRTFNGRTVEYIGNEIRGLLDSLPMAVKKQAVGVFGNGRYLLSFPNNFTLSYDLVTQKWEVFSWSFDFAISAFDDGGLQAFIHTNQPNGTQLVSWPSSVFTDLGAPISWYLERNLLSGKHVMGLRGPGMIKAIKRFRELEIVAPPQNVTITVDLVVDGDTANKAYTTTVNLADAPKSIGLPANMVGKNLKLKISGSHSSEVTIHGCIVWGYLERPYGKRT